MKIAPWLDERFSTTISAVLLGFVAYVSGDPTVAWPAGAVAGMAYCSWIRRA